MWLFFSLLNPSNICVCTLFDKRVKRCICWCWSVWVCVCHHHTSMCGRRPLYCSVCVCLTCTFRKEHLPDPPYPCVFVCVCTVCARARAGTLSAMPSRHCRGKQHTRAALNIVASYHSNGMVIRLSSLRQWWEWTGHAAMLFIYAFAIQLFHSANKKPS